MLAVTSTAALAATLAGCGGAEGGSSGTGSAEEIIIGMPAAMTGPGAAYGLPQANAAQMVVDAINEAGGITELDGATLKLRVEDTKSDPATAAKIVRELIGAGVSAMIGPTLSAETLAAKPVIQSQDIPDFVGSTDVTVTQDNVDGQIFRIQGNIGTHAEDTVEYLSELIDSGTVDVDNVGLLTTSIPPGTSVAPVLEDGLTDLGLETTKIEYDPSQVKDFAPIVAKLAEADVDMVLGFQTPNDAVLFAQAVAGQSWRPSSGFFFSGSAVYLDSFRQSAGSAASGWLTVAPSPTVDSDYFPPEVKEIAEAFEAKYGASMEGTSATLGASYVALVADAIAAAKSSEPADIARAARELTFSEAKDSAYPYYMLAGGVDFDENQDNAASIQPVLQVTADGGLITVFPADIASGELEPLG
jgi:ABC-type branched-subunit amino acid transport system substrate-binding protein